MLLASVATGCGSSGSGGKAVTLSELTPPFEVALTLESGECRAMIVGQTVDRAMLVARGTEAIRTSVQLQEDQFGRVDEVPSLRLRERADLPWRCVGSAIFHMERAGFARLLFELPDGRQIKVDLPFDDPNAPPPPIPPQINRIMIGQTGRPSWNGAPVTAEQLGLHLREAAAMRPEPELEIDPSPGTRLDAVISLLAQVRDAGIATSRSDQQMAPGTVHDDIGPWGFRFVGLERFAGDLK